MAKNYPNLAVGYGPKPGVITTPGAPVMPAGSGGNELVKEIRSTRGWGR